MSNASELKILHHPYRRLTALSRGRQGLREAAQEPGTGLVWIMGHNSRGPHGELVKKRPGGLPLLVVLPEPDEIAADATIAPTLAQCRPAGVLPYHQAPEASDLAQVLRRPPSDLAAEVSDYLRWRGLLVERDTLHLLRQIIDLSRSIRSVEGLARGMYMSRRALGRRLTSRGLPVPSHWLHVSRLLRLSMQLQNTETSLFSLACSAGYPDGFSASNQMKRLIGCRPTTVRERLGWEWILEAWLRREAENGGLAPATAAEVASGSRSAGGGVTNPQIRSRRGRPRRRLPG